MSMYDTAPTDVALQQNFSLHMIILYEKHAYIYNRVTGKIHEMKWIFLYNEYNLFYQDFSLAIVAFEHFLLEPCNQVFVLLIHS